MGKHRRRRRPNPSWLGPDHPAGCSCAGDHCGQVDALRAARRRHAFQPDDYATFRAALSIGLKPRSRRAA